MAEIDEDLIHGNELIAQLPRLEHALALFRRIEDRVSLETKQVYKHPKICNEDIKEDFRYKLGFVAALSWVLELPEQAKQLIQGRY